MRREWVGGGSQASVLMKEVLEYVLHCRLPNGKDNCLAEMWSGSDEGSYLRLIDCGITQL